MQSRPFQATYEPKIFQLTPYVRLVLLPGVNTMNSTHLPPACAVLCLAVPCSMAGPDPYASADALTFTSTNEYPPVIHSSWPLLAEPFRHTTFTASSRAGDPENDVFKWSFEDGTVLEGK